MMIQTIGFIGYGLVGVSYLAKRKERILLWSLIGGLIIGLHFYLLDGLSGALCNLVGGGALLVIYIYDKCGKRNKLPLILLMIPVSAIIAWSSWAGPASLLPIFATTIILAGFISSQEKYIRIANAIGGTIWLIYGFVIGSISSMICETFIILMTVIALWKYRDGKTTPKSKRHGRIGAKGKSAVPVTKSRYK